MKRAALYVRVSTEEQKRHGHSVASQVDALREYCANNGLYEIGLYNDAGISARKRYTKRPELLRLIADCKAGKIDVILFTKLDRWFRSVADYYEVQNILDASGVAWRAIWEDYETETSSGTFKVNIMLSVAQAESDRTSERIKAVKDYCRKEGKYVGGHAPYGYKIENKQMLYNEKEYAGVRALFDTYLRTFSTRAALDAAAENGLFLNRSHVKDILKRPCYTGATLYGLKCPAYITQEEQQRIIAHKEAVRKPKRANAVFLFSGLLKCGYCGCRMGGHTLERKWTNGGNIYQKYTCVLADGTKHKHQHLQITEMALEKTLLAILDEKLRDYKYSVDDYNASFDNENAIKEAKKIKQRLSRLAKLFEFGDIDEDEYLEKRTMLQIELDKLEAQPKQPPKQLPDKWIDIYYDLDKAGRREFWLTIIDDIIITNETKSDPVIHFS